MDAGEEVSRKNRQLDSSWIEWSDWKQVLNLTSSPWKRVHNVVVI